MMEFTQYKCPVCNEQFKSGDDIVVCPECGAPHHRECYENNGHCFYEDKHSEDFSFEEIYSENKVDSESTENGTVICKKCGFENDSYFSKTFKKHIGMLPSDFLKEQNNTKH